MERNVVQIMEQSYSVALEKLRSLPFDSSGVEINSGFSQLAVEALNLFDGLFDQFLKEVIKHHNSSCALSNFPAEHNPTPEYIAQTVEKAVHQWRLFAVETNRYFLAVG